MVGHIRRIPRAEVVKVLPDLHDCRRLPVQPTLQSARSSGNPHRRCGSKLVPAIVVRRWHAEAAF